LAIELDGDTHDRPGRREFDARREAFIRSYGIRILRFLNNDVYENLDGVWEAIAREAKKRIHELGAEVQRGRRARRATDTVDPTPPAPPC
jgi:very-short-patch-repair endonuclease